MCNPRFGTLAWLCRCCGLEACGREGPAGEVLPSANPSVQAPQPCLLGLAVELEQVHRTLLQGVGYPQPAGRVARASSAHHPASNLRTETAEATGPHTLQSLTLRPVASKPT